MLIPPMPPIPPAALLVGMLMPVPVGAIPDIAFDAELIIIPP